MSADGTQSTLILYQQRLAETRSLLDQERGKKHRAKAELQQERAKQQERKPEDQRRLVEEADAALVLFFTRMHCVLRLQGLHERNPEVRADIDFWEAKAADQMKSKPHASTTLRDDDIALAPKQEHELWTFTLAHTRLSPTPSGKDKLSHTSLVYRRLFPRILISLTKPQIHALLSYTINVRPIFRPAMLFRRR